MIIGSAVEADPMMGLEFTRPSKDRMFSLDLIRAAAIFMVVLIHSTSPVMYQIGHVPVMVWGIHNVVDSAIRICLPLFFMLSGFFLLAPASTGNSAPIRDVGKRVGKILLPLIVWSLAYRAYGTHMLGKPIDLPFIWETLGAMSQGALVYHLWFLYELLEIYLLLPVLRRLFNDNDRVAIYFFALWTILLTGKLFSALMGWSVPLSKLSEF